MDSGAFISAYGAQLRRITWKALRRRFVLLFRYSAEDRIYRLSTEQAADLPSSVDFQRDCWEDLERFVPTEPRHSRTACLNEWRERLARGEHVYTRVENGRLVSYGWLIERQKTSRLAWSRQTLELPDDCAVIYDFYTLPEYRQRDFYQRLLMHALHDAANIPGTRWIYVGVRGDDRVPRWWVERLGTEYCESYFYDRFLWRSRRWRARNP
jgi:GNAT superfamily N-acetyltransferase